MATGLWALWFGRSGVWKDYSLGDFRRPRSWCRSSREGHRGKEKEARAQKARDEVYVQKEVCLAIVGMQAKITGTACDVSSSRLVWVWGWMF